RVLLGGLAAVAARGNTPTTATGPSSRERPSAFPLRLFYLAPGGWEQPAPNVIGHVPQPRVGNRLAIDSGHGRYFMSHAVIAGGLGLRLVRDGPGCVRRRGAAAAAEGVGGWSPPRTAWASA